MLLARLSVWPDHVRVASEEWTKNPTTNRLALCRVLPLLPGLDLMEAFSAELAAADYEEPAYSAYQNYISSHERALRAMTFAADTQQLYVVESIFQPHGSPHEGWDILFQSITAVAFPNGS